LNLNYLLRFEKIIKIKKIKMFPKSKYININEFQNSIEGKNIDVKNIIKSINNHYTNSFKNPFSNLMLRKTIIRQKIKTLNQIKKNLKQKKKEHKKVSYKQNNLYINFSDYYEQNKQKPNEINNINLNFDNSFDENNYSKNIRNNHFSSHKRIFKSRNIKPLKLLPAYKTIHNIKYQSYTKEYSDKTIVYINNKVVKINRMNITINNTPKFIHFEDNSMQTTKKFLPKIEEKKNNHRFNNKIKNLIYRNNYNTSKIKAFKTTQISDYIKNTPNILYKNKTNNDILTGNEDIYKSISAERNNYLYNEYNSNKEKINIINNNFLSNEIRNPKKNRINIFTLLSLKNKGNK